MIRIVDWLLPCWTIISTMMFWMIKITNLVLMTNLKSHNCRHMDSIYSLYKHFHILFILMYLDSILMLISQRILMKLMLCWILYYFVHLKVVVVKGNHNRKFLINWFKLYWEISHNSLIFMTLWNFILLNIKSLWILCWLKSYKDLMDWLRLSDLHWKIFNWH